jgi:hypothetical protein
MSRTFALLVSIGLAFGCNSDPDRPPVRPGGGGPGGGTGGPDAAPAGDAAPTTAVSGFVCPITDFRFPTACDPEQIVLGLEVVDLVSGNSDLTDSSGSFSIATDGGELANLVVAEQDLTRRTSLLPTDLVSGSASIIAPLMTAAEYDQLLLSLGVADADDTATIVVYPNSGGTPAAGVDVVAPAGTTDVYYDSVDIVAFDSIGPTAAFGTILMFGVPLESGLTEFQIVRPNQTVITVQDVPVRAGTTTLLRIRI